MNTLNKPHDKFFKQSFSDLAVAKDFCAPRGVVTLVAERAISKM